MADKLTRDKEKKDKSSHKSEIKSASDTSHSQKRPIIKAEEDLTEKASTLSPPPSPNATPVEPEPTVFRYQIYKENIFIDQLISAAADGDYEIVNHLINVSVFNFVTIELLLKDNIFSKRTLMSIQNRMV